MDAAFGVVAVQHKAQQTLGKHCQDNVNSAQQVLLKLQISSDPIVPNLAMAGKPSHFHEFG